MTQEEKKVLEELRFKPRYTRDQAATIINLYKKYIDQTSNYCISCSTEIGTLKNSLINYMLSLPTPEKVIKNKEKPKVIVTEPIENLVETTPPEVKEEVVPKKKAGRPKKKGTK